MESGLPVTGIKDGFELRTIRFVYLDSPSNRAYWVHKINSPRISIVRHSLKFGQFLLNWLHFEPFMASFRFHESYIHLTNSVLVFSESYKESFWDTV